MTLQIFISVRIHHIFILSHWLPRLAVTMVWTGGKERFEGWVVGGGGGGGEK